MMKRSFFLAHRSPRYKSTRLDFRTRGYSPSGISDFDLAEKDDANFSFSEKDNANFSFLEKDNANFSFLQIKFWKFSIALPYFMQNLKRKSGISFNFVGSGGPLVSWRKRLINHRTWDNWTRAKMLEFACSSAPLNFPLEKKKINDMTSVNCFLATGLKGIIKKVINYRTTGIIKRRGKEALDEDKHTYITGWVREYGVKPVVKPVKYQHLNSWYNERSSNLAKRVIWRGSKNLIDIKAVYF